MRHFVLASPAAGGLCLAAAMTDPDSNAPAVQWRRLWKPSPCAFIRATIIMRTVCALAAILVAGCGEKPDDTFRILWQRGFVPEEVVAKFSAETGVKTSVETYANERELDERLSARRASWDLVAAPDHMLQALAKAGRLHKLDPSEVPNIRNLDPAFLQLPLDPGCKFTAPWMAGFMGIVYNAETVTIPVVGFSDVFRDEHTGRIAAPGDAREIASWAFLTAGIPINDATDANLATATPLLANWLPKVGVFEDADPGKSIAGGETDIGVVDSVRAARLFAQNPAFQWVLPAEGFRMFVLGLAIPKTAAHRDAAEAFINFVLRPGTGKMISAAFPGFNPNAEARRLLSQQQLDNPASYPVGIDVTKAEMFTEPGAQAFRIDETVARIKAPPAAP